MDQMLTPYQEAAQSVGDVLAPKYNLAKRVGTTAIVTLTAVGLTVGPMALGAGTGPGGRNAGNWREPTEITLNQNSYWNNPSLTFHKQTQEVIPEPKILTITEYVEKEVMPKLPVIFHISAGLNKWQSLYIEVGGSTNGFYGNLHNKGTLFAGFNVTEGLDTLLSGSTDVMDGVFDLFGMEPLIPFGQNMFVGAEISNLSFEDDVWGAYGWQIGARTTAHICGYFGTPGAAITGEAFIGAWWPIFQGRIGIKFPVVSTEKVNFDKNHPVSLSASFGFDWPSLLNWLINYPDD